MKTVMKANKKKQRGALSIEFLVVVAGILILGGILARYAFNSTKKVPIEEDNRLATELARCVKDSRTGVSYVGLDMATLVKTRCLDDLNVTDNTGKVFNPYGGAVDIEVTKYNNINNQGVEISSTGYSAQQCIAAATHRISMAPIVNVNGDAIKSLADRQVVTADITSACDDEANNEVSFTIGR